MNLVTCPNCKMRVLPKPDGTCPSCQAIIPQKEKELVPKSIEPLNINKASTPMEEVTLKSSESEQSLRGSIKRERDISFLQRSIREALKGFVIGIIITIAILVFMMVKGLPIAADGGTIFSLAMAIGVYCAIIGFCSTKPNPKNIRFSIILVASGVIVSAVGVFFFVSWMSTNNTLADFVTLTIILAMLVGIWCSMQQFSKNPIK